ncbi:TolC family protein [Niabella drilacis]|uniref:Outer membrane protein TolC n=1 Tax=Niabella drilacis (strain DSM 25811 / CCM 8410 / CCUG 62505 / LMG 26954 / E90) TaxID=1285928 RepID=A0A1G6JPI6_NIADE|nr:TolC family protein [Niabella drilacis]SDC20607.1 Outer membrane protein TolC [Niabella drilacis]
MNNDFYRTRQLSLLLLILICSVQVRAQRLLTLEEAIATALLNNYQIQLSKNDSTVASIDYSYRNMAFLPVVNGNAGLTNTNNNQKQTLADGTQRKSSNIRSNNVQANVTLNWVLFDGLKMFATRDKAAALLEAGEYTIKEQIVNTIASVINNYYAIARGKQQIEATDVQIKLNEERAKLAQNKLDIGTGAKPDVLQSKVDLNSQRSLRMQQEVQVAQLKEQLAQAMNSQIDGAAFDIPDTIPLNYDLSLGSILDGIELDNPSLQLAKTRIQVAQYTLKESKAGLYPTLSFNSMYNFTRTENKKVINPFSTLFNQSHGYNYGLTASIPIFNQLSARRDIKQSRWSLKMEELNYDNQHSLIRLSALNSYKNYDQQKRALKLEEENIELAKENVDIVFQTYKLGMATLVQLREAQLSLAQAYDRLIEARYNTKLSETELMRLKGDIIK